MALSALELEMSMNIARLQTDAGKAVKVLESFGEKARTILNVALAGFGAVYFARQFSELVKVTIDSADRMNDLRTRTGLAGQELMVLQGAAVRGGTSLETISDTVSKLGKRLGAAELGTGEAARGFEALGMKATRADGSLKNINEIMREAGGKFAEFEDGADKAALATAVFGKGGDKLIPVIQSIAEVEERFKKLGITIDEDFITAADRYNDTLADLDTAHDMFARMLVAELLPYMQDYRDLLVEMATNTDSMGNKVSAIMNPLKTLALGLYTVVKVASAAIHSLVGFGLSMVSLSKATWSFGKFDEEGMLRNVADAKEAFRSAAKLVNKDLNDILKAPDYLFPNGGAPSFPKAPFKDDENWMKSGDKKAPKLGDPKALQAAKQAQDAYQKMLESFSKMSMEAVKDQSEREKKIIEDAYADKLMSAKEYFDGLAALQTQQYEATRAELLQRKSREDAAASAAPKGTKEYYDAVEKVGKTLYELSKLEKDRAVTVTAGWREQANAARNYLDAIDDIRTEMLALTGRERDAEQNRIDAQQAMQRMQFGDQPDVVQNLDKIREQRMLRFDLNKLTEEAGNITGRLALEEERIERSARVGSISQIESMRLVGAARQQALVELKRFSDAYTEMANNGGTERMQLDAARLREELAKLGESADVLGNKIRTTFEDAFSNSFADFVSGTKSMKDAFADFALSVIRDLAKMQAQALAKSIFNSAGGGGGGFGDIFGGIADFFGGLFKAEGGPVAGGGSYIVGERGPEIFTPGVSGNITPNGGGGMSIVQNIRIDSRSDQATILAAVRSASQQALSALSNNLNRGGSFARKVGTA